MEEVLTVMLNECIFRPFNKHQLALIPVGNIGVN